MLPRGPICRYLAQHRPQVISTEDTEPSDNPNFCNVNSESNSSSSSLNHPNSNSTATYINPRLPRDNQFSYLHPEYLKELFSMDNMFLVRKGSVMN